MRFKDVRKQYLAERKIILKPRTYIGHSGKLKLFQWWLKKNDYSKLPLRKIDDKILNEFSIYLADVRDLDKATCIKYRDTLGVFFKFARSIKVIKKIPLKRFIIPIKKRDCQPKYIPEDKIVALLTDIRQNDYQLFVGFMLQYCSAIRPGNEMLNLKPSDFNFITKTIKVGELDAKVGKQRYADLTEELTQYLIEYGIQTANQDHYLFGKRRTFGEKMICQNNLRVRFNKYRDKHGIDKGVKYYSAKHTGCTDLINNKILHLSTPQVMKHLGHGRISSTEHYILDHVGITNDDIKEQFKSKIFNQ